MYFNNPGVLRNDTRISISLSGVLLISHIRSKDAKLFYIIFLAELRQDIL
jgi:hypothetical protein